MATPQRTASEPKTFRRHVVVGVVFFLLGLLVLLAVSRPRTPAGVNAALAVGLRTSDPHFERRLARHAHVAVESDNLVDIVLDGDGTFPAVWDDLRQARRSILIQQYFSREGAIADTLAEILSERARAGVAVRVLLDSHGSSRLNGTWARRLRASGVSVVMFRPLRWTSLYSAGHRSHVRAIVVDDSIAYSGGVGFADTWLGDGASAGHWRETNVRIQGPAALQLQAMFANAWFEATGQLLCAPEVVFPARPDTAARIGVLHTAATNGTSRGAAFLTLAIRSAERRLYVSSSYFVPDSALRAELGAAARRGVDVRVLTAGKSTDVRLARFAGRNTYGELLRDGVRVYEYAPTMMHAKTFVIDGTWASIGSMNLDRRSMALNDEISVLLFDRRIASLMDSIFVSDLRLAEELTLGVFERRSVRERGLEWLATLMSRLL